MYSQYDKCGILNPVSRGQSHLSHHPHKLLLAQFSLYVHKSGLKPHLFIHLVGILQVEYLDRIPAADEHVIYTLLVICFPL